MRKLRYWFATL